MLWNRRYVIRSYMRSSLWLMPFFALLGYMVVHRIMYGIGAWLLRTGRIDLLFWPDDGGGARHARDDRHS